MNRFICLHGHFYQPPRENPWLDEIERQPSAFPHPDWNHRVAAECYAPNSAARILDPFGRIEEIVDNYAGISFNFGPTLLSWLERYRPGVYATILEADRVSGERFSGHGSAIAQVYNHLIMPLANPRDQATQVRWGVRDFEHRFGRRPEGIWLAETAVDLRTLEACAAEGLAFTILAPHQAGRVRRAGAPGPGGGVVGPAGAGGEDTGWVEVTADTVDTRRAYRCPLPSGRRIALFFYDGAIARDLAFGNALENGERFADRLLDAFGPAEDHGPEGGPSHAGRIVHAAVDGETFGHHHPFGDMALAWCLRRIESSGRARLTNYGEFLAAFPPADEVEIVEETAWSCAHGLERWRSDCGCRIAARGGGTQAWRAPLRAAMDALRDRLTPIYEESAVGLLRDPWAARDAYIDVLLDRSDEGIGRFLATHAGRSLSKAETAAALRLLEMQRHALLMYTSCGWFFDDIAGLEAVQVMRYAARAMRLALKVSGVDLEPGFRAMLAEAPCNDPACATGAEVWDAKVRPSRFGPRDVGARFAVETLFGRRAADDLCGWRVEQRELERVERGGARAAVGRALFRSRATRAVFPIRFAALHAGAPDAIGCVVADDAEDGSPGDLGTGGAVEAAAAMGRALERGDLSGALGEVEGRFGPHGSLIDRIPGDARGAWLHRLIRVRRAEVDGEFQRACRDLSAARVLATGRSGDGQSGIAAGGAGVPRTFRMAAALRLCRDLRAILGAEAGDACATERIVAALKGADVREIAVGGGAVGDVASRRVEAIVAAEERGARDAVRLEALARFLRVLHRLPIPLDLWHAQNAAFRMRMEVLPGFVERAAAGDGAARRWVEAFGRAGALLGLRIRGVGGVPMPGRDRGRPAGH